jgi:Tol biopolymer transport system component
MALGAGTTLGPYEILALIGAGGMGEVYRARDARLKRDVALKVLPESFAQDAGRMARFDREAQVLASLNHPNIAQIYGVEDRALVMELVEGESPAGPLPVEETLKIALQMAEALEYAHEKVIVHRDLKPANIKITPEGTVKLLDFGLAKAIEEPTPTAGDAANSPTLTLGATRVGVILGTAAYMSPEQAAGKQVDRRADIWSFGAVLYELLSGKQAFDGDSVSDTLASVLKVEPDWSALPKSTPPAVRRLVRRCLTKDRKQRLQAIGEARIAIEEARTGGAPELSEASTAVRKGHSVGWVAATAVLTVTALGLGSIAYRHFREEPARVLRTSVLPPEKAVFNGAFSIPEISPDGRKLAVTLTIAGKSQLWLRDLDSLSGRALAGTEGAALAFWSPDSQFIGFFAGGKLKKIDVAGGSVLALCDAPNARGGTWNQNGVILFNPAPQQGLFRVPAEGGTPAPVTTPDPSWPGSYHRAPWFLPDGHHFLYTARSGQTPERNSIYLADLDAKDVSKSARRVVRADSNAVYASGYLLFARSRTLMAQRFDAARGQTTGNAFPVAEADYLEGNSQGQFSASQNGMLAFSSAYAGPGVQMTWFDRSGKSTGTLGAPADIRYVAISPDGKTVAFDRRDSQNGISDVWLRDLARGVESRFTFDGNNQTPVWSPDSSSIAFRSFKKGNEFARKSIGGSSEPEVLLSNDAGAGGRLWDWSPDGRYLLYGQVGLVRGGGAAIWVMPLSSGGERKPFTYSSNSFNQIQPRVSPNGRWLAYASDETGRFEVYVVTFPMPGGKWQVSVNGGNIPVWSRDGKELFYISADRKMMAVAVGGGPQFDPGQPKALFDTRLPTGIAGIAAAQRTFDVSRDGRFLIPVEVAGSETPPIHVVVNWTAGLKQ